MADDYKRTLSRGSQNKIDSTPIEDGKIRFAKDTQRLFIDLKSDIVSKRIEITDLVKNYTQSEILNLTDPIDKIYISKDTSRLFIYDFVNHTWKNVSTNVDEEYVINYVAEALANYSNSIFIVLSSKSELIPPGISGKIYLVPGEKQEDKNKYDEYVWVSSKNEFEKFGSMELDLTGYYHSLSVSGSGNAVTDIYYDAAQDKLMFVKNTTFLVNSDLNGYINDVEYRGSSATPGANAYGAIEQDGNTLIFNKDKYHYDKINTTGDGNAITNITTNRSTINVTKGATYLTASDTIANATYATTAGSANSVSWANVDNKPTSIDYAITAGSANAVDWANVDNKPTYYNATTATVSNFESAVKAIKVNNATYADSAGSAVSAGSANYALYDESGNNIKATYGATLSTSGNSLTLKNKNGTTVSAVTVPYATSAGSASTADESTKATQDESGNNIKYTYGATLGTYGNSLTLKNKNGETISTITVPYATNANNASSADKAGNTTGDNSLVNESLWDFGALS